MTAEEGRGWEDGPSESDDPGNFNAIVPHGRLHDFNRDGVEDGRESAQEARELALQRWLVQAFDQGYDRYLSWIGPLLDAKAGNEAAPSRSAVLLDPSELTSRLPSLPVTLTAEWDERPADSSEALQSQESEDEIVEVVFDGELMATLLDVYLLEGWRPLRTLGDTLYGKLALLEALRRSPRSQTPFTHAQIVDLAPWEPAEWLFRLARNGVGQLVRQGLSQNERLASIQLTSRIARTQTEFERLVGPLKWTKKTEERMVRQKDVQEKVEINHYTLEDRALAKTLETALREAVPARARLDLTLSELAAFQAVVTRARKKTPSDDVEAVVARSEPTYKQAVKEARALAEITESQLRKNAPLLLLVFDSLKPDFESEKMEWLLHDRIEELRSTLAGLRDKLILKVPLTELNARGVNVDQAPHWKALIELAPPPDGVEKALVDLAIAGTTKAEPRWLSLLSERTLHELVAREQIRTDSFQYVVYAHYVQTLSETLDELARDEDASRAFWQRWSRWTAAAGLDSVLLLPAAPISAALGGAAFVSSLVLMFHSAYSITGELRRVEQLAGQDVAEASSTVQALGALGELLAIRQDLIDALAAEQAMALLTTILARFEITLLRRALVAWGFYQDLEILRTEDDISAL